MQLILSLGSNLGDREGYLAEARKRINELFAISDESPIIETEPWGYESSNSYLNQVIVCESLSDLDPEGILDILQQIERNLGRTVKSTPETGYSDRTIDIDILYLGDMKIDTPRLKIPHPHIEDRDFLIKLLDSLKID